MDVTDLADAGIEIDLSKARPMRMPDYNAYSPRTPSVLARAMLEERELDRRPLIYWRGQPYEWTGTYWTESLELPRWVIERLERTLAPGREKDSAPIPYPTTRSACADVESAMSKLGMVTVDPPAWIDGESHDWELEDTLVTPAGLFHARTREVRPPDRRLFTRHRLGVTPAQGVHPEWDARLARLPDDEAQCLREFFGLCLVPDTRHQKILSLVGPKRSGKGTLLRLLRALMGESVVSSSPRLLGERFGLSNWPGALVAMLADARWEGDLPLAVERLLSVSGEDAIPVEVKHGAITTTKLAARIVIAGNSDPKVPDPSGAIASRFLSIHLRQSFEGEEDTAVGCRLHGELPAIAWDCLDALAALRARGHFVEPAASIETKRCIREAASPQLAWLEENCEVGPDLWETRREAWADYQAWTREAGHHAGSRRSWLSALRYSARIEDAKRAVGGKSTRVIEGLRLRVVPERDWSNL